jgi:superfamily II DNA or RNA helicase
LSTDILGQVKYHESRWHLLVKPHIAIRVKRLFPRADQARTGVISIDDTPEVARDLEWLLQRHPLKVDDLTMARLTARADEHRAVEEAVVSILAGGRMTGDNWTEPARPGREYQTQAADLIWRTHRLLLADDIGLGKTQSATMLFRDPNTLPALIVVPTALPKQWLRELNAVMPQLRGHVLNSSRPYDIDADVLITSYSKLAAWGYTLAGHVKSVIFDEVQELRHAETAKWNAAGMIADKADWRMGLSATPVYNFGGEIHSILSIIAPGELGTRKEFIREWGAKNNGKDIVKQPAALGQYLRDQGLLLRRTRADVHRELPEPIKIVQEIDADERALDAVADDVAAMAALILDRNSDGKDRFKMSGEMDWKLRQATGIAKAPYVAAFAKMLLESEEAIVLFGWHRAVYDLWLKDLAEFNPVLYTGTESPKQKDESVQTFLDGKSRVMIMSLRSGAGLDGIQKRSSVCVFGELDWSPEMHNQCIGRLGRDGQEATVAAYFLVADSGSDPVISDVLELKRQQAEPIRDPDVKLLAGAVDTTDRMKRLAESVLARAAAKKGAA